MATITIHRTRIGKDIIAEFSVPGSAKARAAGKVAVLCHGAPTMPGKASLMEFLTRKGFYVVNPRYRGSWESSGTFLKDEPTKDIADVIDALAEPLMNLYEGKTYAFPKKPKIHLFVSSFGGPAGFFLSKDPRVVAVIAFAPVCDWQSPSQNGSLSDEDAFVRTAFGEGYRIAKNGYARLATGTFYNPISSLERINGEKCLIFHARNDDVVPFRSVFDFAYATGATLKASRTGGHMGLSEAMDPETWREITRFLR
jgi:dipeptidyl aminopeptidase/acylaminoacyl peptidase